MIAYFNPDLLNYPDYPDVPAFITQYPRYIHNSELPGYTVTIRLNTTLTTEIKPQNVSVYSGKLDPRLITHGLPYTTGYRTISAEIAEVPYLTHGNKRLISSGLFGR